MAPSPPLPRPPAGSASAGDSTTAQSRAALANRHALLRLHGRLVRNHNRALFEFGVTNAQLRLMQVIARSRRLNLSRIAERLDLTRQAVHRVMHDLARLGLLELHRDPADRRAIIPAISAVGAVYAGDAFLWQEGATQALTSVLRLPDLEFTTAVLERLWRRLT